MTEQNSDLIAIPAGLLQTLMNSRLTLPLAQMTMSVEREIAILYCGTHNLLKDVPLEKVAQFEEAFLKSLELNYPQVLEELAKGVLTAESEQKMEEVASKCLK